MLNHKDPRYDVYYSVNIGNPLGKHFNLTPHSLFAIEGAKIVALWAFSDNDKKEVFLTGEQLRNIVRAASDKKENLDVETIQAVLPEGIILAGPVLFKELSQELMQLRKEAKNKILTENH